MNYLVIDVGGSAIKYALMNDDYEMLEKGKIPTPKASEGATKEDFINAVKELYLKYKDEVEGIAMSLPGLYNKKTKVIQIPGALDYNQNVDILAELKKATTDHVVIENDAKCAALCEVARGALKGTDVGAVCILGTGIGGGITIGNEVFVGAHGFAGEFSYLHTRWNEPFNSFDKAWAMEAGAVGLVCKILAACDEDPKSMDGLKAFELCNSGDKRALGALKEFTDLTARGLYNLQATFDPDKIAIGGGISQQPILLEYIQKSLDEIYKSMPVPIPQVQIVPCQYFNDSNLIGALVKYKETF